MEQKKKEQDVLVVRDEQTGEIGVVAGLKRDGTPNMKAAKPEHAQDFLRFDRHGDVLDNFFANFFRQCTNPKRFAFYRVTAEGIENVLAVMKEMLKKPDEYRDVLAAHRVDTIKYEQQAEQMRQETPDAAEKRQEPDSESQTAETGQQQTEPQQTPADEGYKPIDDSRLDRAEVAERWGIDLAALEQSGDLERMRNYGKSRLIDCNPEIGGIRVPMQARLSLRENPDGTVSLVPHPIRRAPNLDEYLNVKFTPEDQENLKKTGNLGRVVEVADPATGELLPSFVSIDRITNETVSVPVRDINIPQEVLGAVLDDKQQAALARGEGVYVEGMTSKNNGKVFNATIQINADRRGLDFHFGERKQRQRQEQTAGVEKQEKPRKLRIGSTLLQRPVTDEIKKGWEQNKWVYMEGLIDRKGKPFNAYVRPNHERGKYDFSRKRPEEGQIHEIKPDNASRTQVAVNSEGKTHEATKHVGEPLQRGQTAPANEEQQRRQQNANRPRMKM
ncbi:DUF4099 domain-containing protein [Alistipes putredinis]|uniref:DUF4099 domain-containing protein n=2 Tax=Alistipes putredinis TaxID=28117 RepID=UPI00242C5B49|nr:DUF4099 domain-containing protein [Alistipes putredinis]